MLTEVRNQLKIMRLSVQYALQREMLNKVTFLSNIIFMILNNASFIIQWIVLFSLKDDVGGYTMKQIILLWGLASESFGIAHFFFKEAFDLTENIHTGKLDTYLIQPKNVLLSCITSSVEVSCIGDMIYGYIMLIIYGLSIKKFFLFTLFSITGAFMIVSVSIIFSSLSFWFGKIDMIPNTLNNMIINFSTYPEGIFKGFIKILFYTIMPIGFIIFLPIKIITSFKIIPTLIILLITTLLVLIAFITFYQGLKHYSSSNLMNTRS